MTPSVEESWQHDLPSHMRTVPGSVNVPVARLPLSALSLSDGDDLADLSVCAENFVQKLNEALSRQEYAAIADLFVPDGYWRDHLALSWRFRTLLGVRAIRDFLHSCEKSKDGFRIRELAVDASSPVRRPRVVPMSGPSGTTNVLNIFLTVSTKIGSGRGIASLVKDDQGSWKIFTLYTRLDELRNHEEKLNQRRGLGVEHGKKTDRTNWSERRDAELERRSGTDPAVLIIGSGQAGLTSAARLKMLGVDALVIESNDRVGDNWRKRYHQLVLHDPVWYDHLPYIPFPPQWPVFTPKDKLAQFFEAYAALLELNIWTRTSLVDTQWDEAEKTWTVTVDRKREDGTVESRELHPRHIVQATGHSGKKNQPSFPGADTFNGDIFHSSEFPGARADGHGKQAVVVGSCNSAHDIAQDYLEHGYQVTIVQRSSTLVVSSHSVTNISLASLYAEHGPPVDDADLMFHSMPTPVLKAAQIVLTKRLKENDREILEGLENAGFKVDYGPDDAGSFIKYLQRGGGYYIDVGASRLIADGAIRVKQGQEIEKILPHGLKFADGTELEADEIVLATGYQNMKTQTRLMFGDHVADRVPDVWGLDQEGELRAIGQRTGHPGFWFFGGNLALCRYYSKLLALQIKGLEEGIFQTDDD